MRKLRVEIEIDGVSTYVGDLAGNGPSDTRFSYTEAYLAAPESRPISISLPLQEEPFDAVRTQNFFEGMLPEAFTRKCVAAHLHAAPGDYITLLEKLGRECPGAVTIQEADMPEQSEPPAEYRELAAEEILQLAQEGASPSEDLLANAVITSQVLLAGASGKTGLYYEESAQKWYLPIGTALSTHVIKQSHVRLKRVVINEQLCQLTAGNLGIEIPDSFIVRTDSPDAEDVLFATKRYDRRLLPDTKLLDGVPVPCRLHQEDFSQALGIPLSEKYEENHSRYLQRAFDLIRRYSGDPASDQWKLWDLIVFHYLIGNTDNHVKNFSLLYRPDLQTMRLAPAYDIVSTVVYESRTEKMSMAINGVYNIYEITRESFAEEARQDGLNAAVAMEHFDAMASSLKQALCTAAEELVVQGFPEALQIRDQILERRRQAL